MGRGPHTSIKQCKSVRDHPHSWHEKNLHNCIAGSLAHVEHPVPQRKEHLQHQFGQLHTFIDGDFQYGCDEVNLIVQNGDGKVEQ